MNVSRSPHKRMKRYAGIIGFLVVLPLITWYVAVQALAPAGTLLDLAGYIGSAYPETVSDPTASKPESKLWWHDGIWWGVLFASDGSGGGSFNIHRYDWGNKEWIDTGVVIDTRLNITADVLWDDSSNKVYIVAHKYDTGPNSVNPGDGGKLYRFSYDAVARTYSLDDSFPVEIALHGTESMVLTKDSTGQLWTTFVSIADGSAKYEVFVNRSLGDDLTWGEPFTLGTVDKDDVSSVVAFTDSEGAKVGILWSDQDGTPKFHFSTHLDSDDVDTNWKAETGIESLETSDDSVNMVAYNGHIYAAVQTVNTGSADIGIGLMHRTPAGVWSVNAVTPVSATDARPIVVIDQGAPATNGDEFLYVVMAGKSSGNAICYQKSSLSSISFGGGNCSASPSGAQVLFIADDATTAPELKDFNNPTSSKQVLSKDLTGLVVVGSSETLTTQYYGFNFIGDPPAVVYPYAPANGASVPASSVIEATFSREMDQATLTTSNFIVEGPSGPIAGSVSYNNSARKATFTPNPPLIAGLDYTVKLTSGIKDSIGRPLREGLTSGEVRETWSFSTQGTAVRFNPTTYNVTEGTGSVTLSVNLTKASAQAVTVDYSMTNGTATGGNDFVATPGTITFAPGETNKTFSVNIIDDAVVEVTESFTVSLSNATNASLGASTTATVTIADNEGVQFTSTTYSVAEDGGSATITVVLSGPSTNVVSVGYQTQDGTALAGSDYNSVSGTLVFPIGETVKTFNVPIIDDTKTENSEELTLKLLNPVNVSLGPVNTATLTILDDEGVQFSSATYNVNENAGQVEVTVQMTGTSPDIVQVDYATSNGTAIAGQDYVATSGTVVFNAGETTKTISIPITDDGLSENNETFSITLSNSVNVSLGSPKTAVITIIDNETVQFSAATYSVAEDGGSATITVQLAGEPQAAITVDYATSSGTATLGVDYTAASGTLTFNPGEIAKTFIVPILDDNVVEAPETINLTLSNPTNASLGTNSTAVLTIADNEGVKFSALSYQINEDGGAATITVQLIGTATSPVTVHYSTVSGTATAGQDYTSATDVALVFNIGESTKTFNVPILEDDLREGDETLQLKLTNPINASLSTIPEATLTIHDNEAPVTASFTVANVNANENIGTATLTVNLSGKSQPAVSLNFATVDETTTAGADYTPTSGTLTFNTGETSKTISVPIIDDAEAENIETLKVVLSNPVNATLGALPESKITIFDDENAARVQFSAENYSVSEGGASVAVQVTLSKITIDPVTVTYATSNGTATAGSDYTTTTGNLIMSPGQTSATFNIPIAEDSLPEDDETIIVTLSNPINAFLGGPATATVKIVDNESKVRFSAATYNHPESAGNVVIEVWVEPPSPQPLTIELDMSTGTATAGADYIDMGTTLQFSANEHDKKITIPIVNDSLDEANETINLELKNLVTAGTVYLGLSKAVLTIEDNDAAPTARVGNSTFSIDEEDRTVEVEVFLSSGSGRAVSVDYAISDGTASASGGDFVGSSGTLNFAVGEISKKVFVQIKEDSLDELNETINFVLSSPVNATLTSPSAATITIVDDDSPATVGFAQSNYSVAEDSGIATVSIALDTASGRPITLNYATSNGTATAGDDYTTTSGTVTFAAGELTKNIVIPVRNDTMDEADETVNLTLSNVDGAATGASTTAVLTILDDDEAPIVRFHRPTYEISEGAGVVNVEVELSNASGFPVLVDYVTTPGTATTPADYIATPSSGKLSFAAGETMKTIAIVLVDDGLLEPTETMKLLLSNPSNANLDFFNETTVEILDNDAAPSVTVQFSASQYSRPETANSTAMEVRLSQAAASTVTVNYTIVGNTATMGTDFLAASSGTLTFSPGQTSKNVTLTILDDPWEEGNETLTVTLSNPTGGATLGSPSSAVMTIIDNDSFRVSLPIIMRK